MTGLLWESEHGPMGGDELNVLEAGHNYGWPVISHGLEPGITQTTREGMEAPIVYWNPTIAPSGIHFYAGTRYPKWRHDLFVTGLGGTALRRLEVKGRAVTHQEVVFNRFGRVRDVVTGPDGLIYLALQQPGAKVSSPPPASWSVSSRSTRLAAQVHLRNGRLAIIVSLTAVLAAGLALLRRPAPPVASPRAAWPPAVAPEDEGAPERTAEESLKTIVVPPGYRVELVAKEPLVEDPILIDFDADGRMWVVEMPAFAMGPDMKDSREGICRVAVLEDLDDDGAMDRRTVFADKLVLPRAIKTLARGVLVGEPPHLWWMRDTNGDLKMDEKALVSDTFGSLDKNPEHNANSLIWGLDNWSTPPSTTGTCASVTATSR